MKEFDEYEYKHEIKISKWYKGCMLAFRDKVFNYATSTFDQITMRDRPYEFVYLALKAK